MKNNSLTKKLIKRYMLTVIGFIALVFIIFIIGAAVCSLKIWYPDDPDYIILKSTKYLMLQKNLPLRQNSLSFCQKI